MPGSNDRGGARQDRAAVGSTLVPPVPETLVPPLVTRTLGGRYEVRGVLGRGGMGEVWLARDLKLQVEVALKVVRPERLADQASLERLRAEVRSARAVSSPHVCRVYDLVEAEGLECVSMEYVDGTTLKSILHERSPLEPGEAREIALQLLAGLSAIHEAGLVHRDVKPENVMVTRSGRVVLMDLGIAKATASGGTVAGTPAYWAPEQAAGAPADPRADVFAAGVVLAEMVAPGGVRDSERRQALWQGLREDTPRVPDTPWKENIRRAVAKDLAGRYPSAQALARALEEVAHRVTGTEEAQPYPGLASFTEAEAEYFFGREGEIEGAWKKLPGRHLLALVGPSGAGKSSFLRAGVIPAKSEGWAHLICTPGDAPFVALGQALVPEVSRDTHAMRQMLRFEDADVAVDLFRRWRSDHREALVLVDQFEELFTLNPTDVQERFASLLSRLVLEADVHVLLSMRDDFLLRCQEHEGLRPVFSDLMPLSAPTGEALRRALVQPALECGYRFEDESLVAEMLQTVEGERGALPLLAFAAASLWERRDRDQGLLTRSAHEAIGGVAGALAQHAEATLERIGTGKLPLVRELFRNLVTAEGTRAVRDIAELLTVFPEGQRGDAENVLKTLIDARLLTSYEAHATEPGRRAGRRVEVVHESLLSAWPRLVHWRTEDEGSAQLRDQLRQAAHLWEEKGKPDDLLWTGTSYQEYQVWRSRYPGGLSESEEKFARAMAARATRRRRVRRMAVAAVITVLAAVAVAVGISRQQAVSASRRAEAAQLLTLGRLRLADHPMGALAYSIASLERSDNDSARRCALEALWQGPLALYITDAVQPSSVAWSPDGRWLALGGRFGLSLLDRTTRERRQLSSVEEGPIRFSPDGRRLVTSAGVGLQVRTLPEGRPERSFKDLGGPWGTVFNDHLLTFDHGPSSPAGTRRVIVRELRFDGTTPRVLGEYTARDYHGPSAIDPNGARFFSMEGGRLTERRLGALSSSARVVGVGTNEGGAGVYFWPQVERAVTGDSRGDVQIWDPASDRDERALRSPADARQIALDPGKRFLATGAEAGSIMSPRSLFLFDLAAPRSAEPVALLDSDQLIIGTMRFSPDGAWLASVHDGAAILWSTAGVRTLVIGHQPPPSVLVAFDYKGDVLSISNEGVIRRWPLAPDASSAGAPLWSYQPLPGDRFGFAGWLGVDAGGRFAVVPNGFSGRIIVVPLDGAKAVTHQTTAPMDSMWPGSIDPAGRLLAFAVMAPGDPEANAVHILDLASGRERVLDTHPGGEPGCEKAGSPSAGLAIPAWLPDGRLITDGDAGLRVWDWQTGTSRLLRPCRPYAPGNFLGVVRRGPRAVVRLDAADQAGVVSSLSVYDLVSGATREITSHGNKVESFALDAKGEILVTGDKNGLVRVGPVSGEEPHLLFGHTKVVLSVAVSPDGRWIASGSEDGTIRLWPMPDLSKPPLHTLPHDELLAKLESLTNLRAVPDLTSDTGWKIAIGPFPGWAKVPAWQP